MSRRSKLRFKSRLAQRECPLGAVLLNIVADERQGKSNWAETVSFPNAMFGRGE